ncbi:MucBP domain-containing protein, partial [Lactococcus lactis]|uniref:MucBP domain-containing protein n=1 Tax=Lactococcus lactis TaxID=1358 RepID=UPI0024182CE0
VTVKYQDEEGNELSASDTLNGKVGLPYESEAKSINGWTVKTRPSNATGTFTEEAQEVVYVYERTEAAPVTVKYQDEEGNELSASDTLNGKVGLPYESEAKSINGWTVKTRPSNATGTFTEEAQEVVYVYERTEAAPVTVKYQDEEGNELSASDTLNGKVGLPYESEAKSINGWTVKTRPSNATGTFTEEAQEVVYVYSRKTDQKIDNKTSHNDKGASSSSKHNLPATGENGRWTIISVGTGLILLMIALTASIFRFKKFKNNK